jgi:hypothetical protein
MDMGKWIGLALSKKLTSDLLIKCYCYFESYKNYQILIS